MGLWDVAAGANPSLVSGRGQGTPWTSRQLIAGPSLMSNVGFSISLKDTSTCSLTLPGAGIWTSDLPSGRIVANKKYFWQRWLLGNESSLTCNYLFNESPTLLKMHLAIITLYFSVSENADDILPFLHRYFQNKENEFYIHNSFYILANFGSLISCQSKQPATVVYNVSLKNYYDQALCGNHARRFVVPSVKMLTKSTHQRNSSSN